MRKIVIAGVLVIISLVIGNWFLNRKPDEKRLFANVVSMLSEDPSSRGFKQAVNPRKFEFPEDLGSHDPFQTEWWYFTGNLLTATDRHFGYQLTFFRRAIQPEKSERGSEWRTNQLYMAHFAVSDITDEKFLSFERVSRGSLGLAGAVQAPFRVWLEDWQVKEDEHGGWDLEAKSSEVHLSLKLNALKPLIFNGEDGLSRKGPERGNASYYYSNTRIDSTGTIHISGKDYEVSGFSWLDREWSTSVLSRNQIGWDWFSIQLSDWREIMLFQIRKSNGGISAFSSGSFVEKDGQKSHLAKEDFEITVSDHWRSPETGTEYPSAWRIIVPSKDINLIVRPLINNQEHQHSFSYWEGAVKVTGNNASGYGYVELTGY